MFTAGGILQCDSIQEDGALCGGTDPTVMTISGGLWGFSTGSVGLIFTATAGGPGASMVAELSVGGFPWQRRTGATQIMETGDGVMGVQEIWWAPITVGAEVGLSITFSPRPTNAIVGVAEFFGSPDINNPWATSESLNARNNITDLAFVQCPVPDGWVTGVRVAQLAFAGLVASLDTEFPDWSNVSGSPLFETIYNWHGQFDGYNPQQLLAAFTTGGAGPPDAKYNLLENRMNLQVCTATATPAVNGTFVNQVCSCFPSGATGCSNGVIGGAATAVGGGVPFPYPTWMMLVDFLKCG